MFSNIKIYPSKSSQGKVRARGRVTIADAVNVNFSVMDSQNGLFVSLPSHKGKDKEGKDKWYPDVFIEDKGVYKDLTDKVLKEYHNAVENSQGESPEPTNQDPGGDSIPW